MALKPLLLVFLFIPQITYAVLPPRYQNMEDLDVIVEFIKQHELILSTLESIDFENYIVRYRNGCIATFERKDIPQSQGWVGPTGSLDFKKSTCSIDH